MKITGQFWLKGALAVWFAPNVPPVPRAFFVSGRKDFLEFFGSFLGEEFLGTFAKEVEIRLFHIAVVDIAATVADLFSIVGRLFFSPSPDGVDSFGANTDQNETYQQ